MIRYLFALLDLIRIREPVVQDGLLLVEDKHSARLSDGGAMPSEVVVSWIVKCFNLGRKRQASFLPDHSVASTYAPAFFLATALQSDFRPCYQAVSYQVCWPVRAIHPQIAPCCNSASCMSRTMLRCANDSGNSFSGRRDRSSNYPSL